VAYKAKAFPNDWRKDKIEVAEKLAANGLFCYPTTQYGIRSSAVPIGILGSAISRFLGIGIRLCTMSLLFNGDCWRGILKEAGINEAPISGSLPMVFVLNGWDLQPQKMVLPVAAADIETHNQGQLFKGLSGILF